ncbi:MAG: hypothetical protein RIA65_10425, partial [Woeseia sp.]
MATKPFDTAAASGKSLLQLPGQRALSDFRLQKALAAVRERVPAVTALTSRYSYFVNLHRELDTSERSRLEALLLADEPLGELP